MKQNTHKHTLHTVPQMAPISTNVIALCVIGALVLAVLIAVIVTNSSVNSQCGSGSSGSTGKAMRLDKGKMEKLGAFNVSCPSGQVAVVTNPTIASYTCQPMSNYTAFYGQGAAVAVPTNAPSVYSCTYGLAAVDLDNVDTNYACDSFGPNTVALIAPQTGLQNTYIVAVQGSQSTWTPWVPT